MVSRLVMGQELYAAIADATQDAPYVAQKDLHEKYFDNSYWEMFDRQLRLLAAEGLVTRHPDPEGQEPFFWFLSEPRDAEIEAEALNLEPHPEKALLSHCASSNLAT